jgi:hypothetical protein
MLLKTAMGHCAIGIEKLRNFTASIIIAPQKYKSL